MEIQVHKKDGSPGKEKIVLSPKVFEIQPNDHAIYQAVRVFMAHQRQGTHATKNRKFVRGGGRKPFKQKGTGNARQGTIRAPQMKGGGTVFGPHPHDYTIKITRKVKVLARYSALSYKAKANSIYLVEDFSFEAPKTKDAAALLKSLKLSGKKILLLTNGSQMNIFKSFRNLPQVVVLPASDASTYDILNADVLLVQQSAVPVLQKGAEA